jgi:uncharacterized protein YjbI with pentapeptide repeats
MTRPKIPSELTQVDDFSSYVQEYLVEEMPVLAIAVHSESIADMDFLKLELRTSIFKDCTLHHCSFENGSVVDVIFEDCDLSNSSFSGAYFERCQFLRCKCVGVDMRDTIFKHTAFEESKLLYSLFDKTKLTDVLFDQADLTEVSMSEAVLKRMEVKNSKLIQNNFFKTMLAGIDFTENEFLQPTLSALPVELKGAVISTIQAADLIGMYGVVVKG